MHELDDNVLLRQYAEQNSETAFAALVARHVNKVYSVALRYTRNAYAAEEITQAVFVILAKKSGRLGRKVIFSGWLYETARLTAVTYIRSEIRRAHREQEAHMQTALNENADDAWPHIAPLLDDAMSKLSEADRHAVVLRYFDGKSLGEVGAAMGASEDAAKKRVTRAVEKLRGYFTKRRVTLTAAILTAAISANSVQAAPLSLAATVTATAAKGAAVSGSILTLIKGALKIMAYTKMKTAAVTGAVVLIATLGTVSTINYFRHHDPPPQNGKMNLPTGNVTPMAAYGFSRFVLFLASNGSIWSWGEERLGWPVLGYSNTNIQNATSLRRIGRDSDWINISAGYSHCLAIKSDGTLWAWGMNLHYNLGDGTKTTRAVPVPSIPGNDWKQVAAGASQSFALKNNGTLWAWGNNWAGNLGVGDEKDRSQARQVGTAANWKKFWAGGIQTVGLQTDGSLWFWGSWDGESAAKDNALVPARISPDTNWVDVCFGYFTVFAIKADGTLWSWGRDARFYVQTSGVDARTTPLQVGNETDWQSCAAGASGYYQLLTKKDGSLWAMDASDHRIVKANKMYKPVKFTKIDWHKDIAAFTAGGDNIGVVMTHDGEVWTWGRVIGELKSKDFFGPKGQAIDPESRIIQKPWQLANIDSEP